MTIETKNQIIVLAVIIAIFAVLIFSTYTFIPMSQLIPPNQTVPPEAQNIPPWLIGLASVGIFIALYGMLALAGLWFAHKLEINGIYKPKAGAYALFLWPMVLGLGAGILITLLDRFFVATGLTKGFDHPGFPLSILASGTAGIGEEIIFRLFILCLFAFVIDRVFKKWKIKTIALWIGNVIAAIAFSLGHLPSAMALLGISSLSEVPIPYLVEGLVLNSIVGLIAGERFMKYGLVAAIGVHFWADIVWHVAWPAIFNIH
jgi:hypothetical protein